MTVDQCAICIYLPRDNREGDKDSNTSTAAVNAEAAGSAHAVFTDLSNCNRNNLGHQMEKAGETNLNGCGSEHHIMSQSSDLGHVCSHDPAAGAAVALCTTR